MTLSRVNANATTLYGEVDKADETPTLAQAKSVAQIESDFTAVMKQWEKIKSADLPAVNRQVRAANLPEVRLVPSP